MKKCNKSAGELDNMPDSAAMRAVLLPRDRVRRVRVFYLEEGDGAAEEQGGVR